MLAKKYLSCLLVCASLLTYAHAEGLLQPVPRPDLSKLAPEDAKIITQQRATIDTVKADLVGPPLAQSYADIGALYARYGLDEAAAVAFYDASQVHGSDGRWFYLRGVIARKLKRNQEARADFEAALALNKGYFPIRYRLADTLIDLGDLAGARRVLDEVATQSGGQAIAFAMIGDLAMRQKRYADAVTAINQALKLEPQADELYVHLADAYAAQGNQRAADDARAKSGKVTPTMYDPLVAGMVSTPVAQPTGTPLEQAQTLARQGRIAAARIKINEILKNNPDDVEALSLSARIESATANLAIAQVQIEHALKVKPDSPIVNLTNGIVAEYAGDDAKAYDAYRRAQRFDAKLPDTYLLLGNAEMRRTRYAQAADNFRELIVLQPDNAIAYAHLIAAQVAQNKCGDALQLIKTALAKHPNDGDLMQIYVRVASTCKSASSKDRDVALDYAQQLYKQQGDASNSSALALALAAHGKFKEAQEAQAQAIFEAVRARDSEGAALYRSTMASFVKLQVPERPWPADHAYFKAPLLSVVATRGAPAAPPAPSKR